MVVAVALASVGAAGAVVLFALVTVAVAAESEPVWSLALTTSVITWPTSALPSR